MLRIDFQNRLKVRCILSHHLQDTLQVRTRILLVGHQTGGRIGQAMGDADFLELITQRFLDTLNEILSRSLCSGASLLFASIFQSAQIETWLGD